MSFDVSLVGEDGEPVSVDSHTEGGTYASGGSSIAWLNVTYNYAAVYGLLGFSLRSLDGQVAEAVTGRLEELVGRLGTKQYEDYWAATPGNAGHALAILLAWAKANPKARFVVS